MSRGAQWSSKRLYNSSVDPSERVDYGFLSLLNAIPLLIQCFFTCQFKPHAGLSQIAFWVLDTSKASLQSSNNEVIRDSERRSVPLSVRVYTHVYLKEAFESFGASTPHPPKLTLQNPNKAASISGVSSLRPPQLYLPTAANGLADYRLISSLRESLCRLTSFLEFSGHFLFLPIILVFPSYTTELGPVGQLFTQEEVLVIVPIKP